MSSGLQLSFVHSDRWTKGRSIVSSLSKDGDPDGLSLMAQWSHTEEGKGVRERENRTIIAIAMVVKGNESLCRALRCGAMAIDAWIDERKSQEEEEKEEDRQGNGIHFRTSGGARTIRNTCQSPEMLSLFLFSIFLSLSETLLSVSDLLCSALCCARPRPPSRCDDNDGWT